MASASAVAQFTAGSNMTEAKLFHVLVHGHAYLPILLSLIPKNKTCCPRLPFGIMSFFDFNLIFSFKV